MEFSGIYFFIDIIISWYSEKYLKITNQNWLPPLLHSYKSQSEQFYEIYLQV